MLTGARRSSLAVVLMTAGAASAIAQKNPYLNYTEEKFVQNMQTAGRNYAAVTDLLAREAVQWLETRGERPFLLYLPFTAVHIPIREPEEYMRRVPKEITAPWRGYHARCSLPV